MGVSDQKRIIHALLNNDEKIIRMLYTKNYPKIEAMILKNNGNKEDAKDIYQEAFIALWKRVRQDNFEIKNESAMDGFIYRVAKNKWMDQLRSAGYKKNVSYDQLAEDGYESVADENTNQDDSNQNKLATAMHAFKNLGDECKNLLLKFYFEKKSMNEIAKELKLDSASTRNKKYRCMKKLKELALQ